MDVDVYAMGLDEQREVQEGVATFGEEGRVDLFEGSFEGCGFYGTVYCQIRGLHIVWGVNWGSTINEEEKGGFFGVVICVGDVSRRLES